MIENHTVNPLRRAEVLVGVAYSADIDETRSALNRAVASVTMLAAERKSEVALLNLGASSVDWAVRAWAKRDALGDARQALIRAVKMELDRSGIGIPFPQLDIHFDPQDGEQALAQLAGTRSQLPLALNAGASGFLPKCAAANDLVRAIRSVARGGLFFDPNQALPEPVLQAQAAELARLGLSERETDTLKLLAAGHAARDIATTLGISVRTLETYRARAMEKLGLKTRVDIIRYAVQRGWLRPN